MAAMDVDGDSLEFAWPGDLPEPSIQGDTATYDDVAPGIDLTLRATVGGFQQLLYIDSPAAIPDSFRLGLSTDGLKPSLTSGDDLLFTDQTGEEIVSSTPALMWDSSINPVSNDPDYVDLVETSISKDATGARWLTLRPSLSWTDRDVTFPLIIDPTPDLAVNKDTYVENQFPNTSYGSDTELKLGSPNAGTQKDRTFIKFGISQLQGAVIQQVTLRLYETWSSSCTASGVDVYRLNEGFEAPTWNSQPALGAIYASGSFAKGFSGSCPSGWVTLETGGTLGRTLTQLTQEWADGSVENYGISLRAQNESSTSGWKKFRSSDAASNPPVLRVTYDAPPADPIDVAVEDEDTTPTFNAGYSHPDGNPGRVRFRILDDDGDVVINSLDGSWVSSGSDSSLTVPSGLLAPDTAYNLKASSTDGVASTPYIDEGEFITSPDLPAGDLIEVDESTGEPLLQIEHNPWGCQIKFLDGQPHASTVFPGNGWVNGKAGVYCVYNVPTNLYIRVYQTLSRSSWRGWLKQVKTGHSCQPEDHWIDTKWTDRGVSSDTDCMPQSGPVQLEDVHVMGLHRRHVVQLSPLRQSRD